MTTMPDKPGFRPGDQAPTRSGTANPRAPAAFAALDLGTNNCRLLVATPAGADFRVIDSFSRIIRLGEGLEASGALNDAAMDRAVDALRACIARLDRRPIRAIRAVATEACRQAANGAAFLARVHATTGLRFDVISPREETELALESCTPLLDPTARRALLFDIGGGSTELAWIRLDTHDRVPQLIGYATIPLGVVTLSERHGEAAFTGPGYQAMIDQVQARLQTFAATHCIGHEIRNGGVQMIGTSGTVTTLAGVALDLPRYRRPLVDGTILSAHATERALARLRTLGRAGLQAHPCVGPERADFVLPGCAVFDAIRAIWPIDEVTVADRGLREGILMRLMRQAGHPRRVRPRPVHPMHAAHPA